jgi:hypothetical protein
MHAALEAPRELDNAVTQREQRVIATTTDVLAGMDAGTTLTHENGAGGHFLTIEPLDAKPLGL